MGEHYAHVSEDGTRKQTLTDHLNAVARIASRFAAEFGAGEYARQAGLVHDLGKATQEFQNRLFNNGPKVDHSTAGAKELHLAGMPDAAFCVAGHHAGIPNGGSRFDEAGESSYCGRLKKEPGRELPDYRDFLDRVNLETCVTPFEMPSNFSRVFFTRMIFSCLVDGDYLDTEAFMKEGAVKREGHDDLLVLKRALDSYLERWRYAKTDINRKRSEILHSCIDNGSEDPGLYSLTVPTGGGKTVSSMAFALAHAEAHRHFRRVIYVIPYTSIIDQTADIFREIFGQKNVVEHHSNVDYEPQDESVDDKWNYLNRLACENWDAPIIITTNVQFFESLFSNRPSRCRKLHNVANSIIIFDEAQMLPLPYLKPCVLAIHELVKHYGCSALLCTATQPSLDKLFPEGSSIKEIVPDVNELYRYFKRTQIKHIGQQDLEELCSELMCYEQCLCIVNTRSQAQRLYSALPSDEKVHLSTLLTPSDRIRLIRSIRERLSNGKPCRVVSTSLIEAGVDLDFPVVFRAEAGLDSVIQAAGRCNREGKLPLEGSSVYLFRPVDKPPRSIRQNTQIMQETLMAYSDIASPESIRHYFDTLHSLKEEFIDSKSIVDAIEHPGVWGVLPFKTVSEEFRLIEADTRMVFVPTNDKAASLEWALVNGERSRSLLRKAAIYSVNIYRQEWEQLIASGDAEMLDDTYAILRNNYIYDGNGCGLKVSDEISDGLFV